MMAVVIRKPSKREIGVPAPIKINDVDKQHILNRLNSPLAQPIRLWMIDIDEINLGDDEPLFLVSLKAVNFGNVANNHLTKSITSTYEEKTNVVLDDILTKSTQSFT
uniref:Uncharacterized protein n=1 Tax=Lactuca sativa TaxID=4236 RepID=A0A9R1WG54_LACSA|nr:hypothetical protein LSAT_V11C200060280 [Lactuca sativa]